MHIVKKGDTLASIARRHRLSVGTLTALNPAVQESPLRLGQPLLLGD